GFEFAVQERTLATPLVIQGYSALLAARVSTPVSLGIAIYAGAGTGEPTGPPLAPATMLVESTPAWYGVTFATPGPLPAASYFHIASMNPAPGTLAPIPASTGAATRSLWARSPCSPAWNSLGQVAIAHRVHCTGTGGPGIPPQLANDGLPSPGQ